MKDIQQTQGKMTDNLQKTKGKSLIKIQTAKR